VKNTKQLRKQLSNVRELQDEVDCKDRN